MILIVSELNLSNAPLLYPTKSLKLHRNRKYNTILLASGRVAFLELIYNNTNLLIC